MSAARIAVAVIPAGFRVRSLRVACLHDIQHTELAALRTRATATFRRGGGTRADVLRVRVDGRDAVLKDHNACDRWFALLLAPLLTRREARALEQLDGVRGVPGLLGRAGKRALLMEAVDGRPIPAGPGEFRSRGGEPVRGDAAPGVPWSEYFARLERLVIACHERGVAHCDLRSPTNALVDAGGDPWVVDFVACVFRGRRWNPLSAWLFSRFRRADLDAVAKLKGRIDPRLLRDAERATMARDGAADRLARRLGSGARELSRLLFTRRGP